MAEISASCMKLAASLPALHFRASPVSSPTQWTCGGELLEIVVDFKYLGIIFHAVSGMAVMFPMLKKKMFGAWALQIA